MATSKVAHKYTGLSSLFEQTGTTVFSSKTGDQVGTKTVTKSGYRPICLAGYSMTGTYSGRAIIHRLRLADSADGTTTIQYSINCSTDSGASSTLNVYICWMKIT